MLSRLTGIFGINKAGEVHLIHAHLSVPNLGQGEDEFVYRNIEEVNKRLLVKKNEDLMLIKTRYEIAMENSDIIIFDYIFETDEIIYSEDRIEKVEFPTSDVKTFEALIKSDIVHPKSKKALREVYNKIKNGALAAEGNFVCLGKNGAEIVYEIFIKNIFDENGTPIRAIGVLRNITEQHRLESEREYRKSMVSDKMLAYEANVTDDVLLIIEEEWAKLLGIPQLKKFSELVDYQGENLLHPEDRERFEIFFSEKNIIRELSIGKTRMILEYRRRNKDEEYHWIESTINIIQDDITGDIKIRCYFKDISEEKALEKKAEEKRQFYETLLPKSAMVYEVNLTKDFFIKGQETWPELFGIRYNNDYSEMISVMASNVIYPDDREGFSKKFNRENILSTYYSGIKQLYYEYRRPNEENEFIWVACTINLREEPETNDVKGYAYVEDINKEKKRELELIHRSEHDGLTGLYNKVTAESLIKNYLKSEDGRQGSHAMLIIDVDYFKTVNDRFGHVFGDVILSKIALNIREAFREQDIVGRIGGDEFIVLMKNVFNDEVIFSKAKQLCERIKERYTQRGQKCEISISIGIAVFPGHGKKFEELYENADTALYIAKDKGRDQYVLYDPKMLTFNYPIKKIDSQEYIESKTFSENVSEYIFRILHQTPDKVAGINTVLELIGNYYQVSRVYFFENTEDGMATNNTFEWCAKNIEPQIGVLQQVTFEELGNYEENFNSEGIYYLPDVAQAPDGERGVLEPQGIKGMLQFKITKNSEFKGFIGFDYCDFVRVPTKKEMTDLRNIGDIIGVFIMEMRSANKNIAMKDMAFSIVNGLDSYAYVINQKSYEILFLNDRTRELIPEAKEGNRCYKDFWKRDSPCEVCPMDGLSEEENGKCTLEIYNPVLEIWSRASASWIKWIDGKRSCLVESVDITELKKAKA